MVKWIDLSDESQVSVYIKNKVKWQIQIKLFRKQTEVRDILLDQENPVIELLIGGGAWWSKTFTMSSLVTMCLNYPWTRRALWRSKWKRWKWRHWKHWRNFWKMIFDWSNENNIKFPVRMIHKVRTRWNFGMDPKSFWLIWNITRHSIRISTTCDHLNWPADLLTKPCRFHTKHIKFFQAVFEDGKIKNFD